MNNYKQLALNFCKEYYNKLDKNIKQTSKFYKPHSKFTFLEDEITGFNVYMNKIKNNYNITSFNHNIKSVDSQPISNNAFLINVIGVIKVNKQMIYHHFTETFVLQQDFSGNFFVCNTIFRLINTT